MKENNLLHPLVRIGGAFSLLVAASQVGCSAPPVRPESTPTDTAAALVIEPPTLTPFFTLTPASAPTETASPTLTLASTETATPTPFETFVESVKKLDKNEYIGGIYVAGLLALKLRAGGGDSITRQYGEATIMAGADSAIIFAHNGIEGSKFWQLSGKTVYFINDDGTWKAYKVNGQMNYWDTAGNRQMFSRTPYPYNKPYLTATDLENMYYPKGKLEGKIDPATIVFQTCLSGTAPEEYKNPGQLADTGVQFTTAGASNDTTPPTP